MFEKKLVVGEVLKDEVGSLSDRRRLFHVRFRISILYVLCYERFRRLSDVITNTAVKVNTRCRDYDQD